MLPPFDEPMDLGPGSLLWRYAGDHRLGFTGLATGILQLMHPGLGAGVAEHSAFFTEPWDRIQRSVPEIMGVIYDADGEATGRRVRDFHQGISGTDEHGRRYSALRPETFWWAHATFQFAVERLIDRFDGRRTTWEDRDRLYRECVEWYRRYDVPMSVVPRSYAEYRDRWDHYCDDVLEMTPAAARAVEMALHEKVTDLPGLPWWSTPIQREVVTPVFRLTAIGGLPARIRRRFDLPWGTIDAAQLRTFEMWVRESWRFVPRPLRYGPRAAEGWRRVVDERRSAVAA
ncbi:oxygenase MpaB family protein [Dermatobacter hominis]|uniref:oxygenase MpaB family protein n=1 Tax=Dermatobacter hominis TaxID=2884263 RepID=UPI001D102E67|nr:oxygenase MpaB family protein [Dermatobacter hominis]UDY36539.1 oxygenase MpaB family protein [Dermatobacter hominis]